MIIKNSINFNKNIILFSIGKLISVFGTSIYTLAMESGIPDLVDEEIVDMLVLFVLINICISFSISIPFMCILQTEIEEIYRARALSIIICIIKIFVPIAFILSGLCLEIVNPFYICLIGAIASFIGSLKFKRKK